MITQILTSAIVLLIISSVISNSILTINAQSIKEELELAINTREEIDQKKLQSGLCSGPDCPDDKNLYELIKKYGYNEGVISTDDIKEFLNDYISDNLVNKTELGIPNRTEEANSARELFDKYW